MKSTTAAALAILVSAGPRAAPAPLVEPPPVRLDAIVTDRQDRPIRDLKVSDFQTTDAGESRPVDAIALQSGGDARLVAIFLDEYHVRAGESTERVRAGLAKFVDADLRPNDLVAIMKPLDSLSAIRLLNVGRDREALQAQIAGFSGRRGDYAPTTEFERNFMSRAAGPADASRA